MEILVYSGRQCCYFSCLFQVHSLKRIVNKQLLTLHPLLCHVIWGHMDGRM